MKESRNEQENQENRKPPLTINLPLASQQIHMIRNALPNEFTVDDIINIITEIKNTSQPETMYNRTFSALEPIFKDKTKQITGMLFLFKRKMCREGNNCTKGYKCIFLHENETVPQNEVKRIKSIENNEICFNKVPQALSNEILIKEFSKKFGPVNSVKKLNEGKFLITFDSLESAKKLMDSKEPVLGSEMITKFFNILPNNESLIELVNEQMNLIDEFSNLISDKKKYLKLKFLTKKIKEKVEGKEPVINKKKAEAEQTFSLYAEYFK